MGRSTARHKCRTLHYQRTSMPRDMKNLIFVDCEATGPCPGKGELTQFGAVEFASRQTFHGVLFESQPSTDNPAFSEVTGDAYDPVLVFADFERWLLSVTNGRCIFVSDNPAYDFQWINYGFHHAIGRNPFGHSGRRIGDFYAGLVGDFGPDRPGRDCASLPIHITR